MRKFELLVVAIFRENLFRKRKLVRFSNAKRLFSKLFESYSTVPYMQLSLKQAAVKLLLPVVKCVPRKEKVTFANHCNFASKFSKFRPLFLYSFPDSNFLSNFRVAKRP